MPGLGDFIVICEGCRFLLLVGNGKVGSSGKGWGEADAPPNWAQFSFRAIAEEWEDEHGIVLLVGNGGLDLTVLNNFSVALGVWS